MKNFTSKSCIVWRLLTKVSTLSWTSPCTTNSTQSLLVIEIVQIPSYPIHFLFSGSLIYSENFRSLEMNGLSTAWRRYAHFYHLSVSIDCASVWGEINLSSLLSSINELVRIIFLLYHCVSLLTGWFNSGKRVLSREFIRQMERSEAKHSLPGNHHLQLFIRYFPLNDPRYYIRF